MNKIFVIGLGPGNIDDLTLGAIRRMESGNPNFLRTEKHPSVQYMRENEIEFTAFDHIYDQEDSFEGVYENIVSNLLDAAREYGVINYFVPGNPMVAENTVRMLLDQDECQIQMVSGMSFIEPLLEIAHADPVEGLKVLDGIGLEGFQVDINSHQIFTQVYNNRVMSEVKLVLMDIYPDDYRVILVHNGGMGDSEIVERVPLHQIDRSENIGPLTSLFVPRLDKSKLGIHDFSDIQRIMRRLRAEDGCPWDRDQDHLSIRGAVLEEAYELVEALEEDDPDHIVEELGDLLLQVVFHTQIGHENGDFNPIQVTSSLANKLITRHPHVFFEKNVDNSEEVVYNWNKIKYANRNITTLSERLRNIPRLPALLRSFKVQEKAADVGFDWDVVDGPSDKVAEELAEVLEAASVHGPGSLAVESEMGDLLFAAVNLSRFLEVNPEVALGRTIEKFTKRLEEMEYMADRMGIVMEEMTLEELDSLWDEVKLHENGEDQD
ncbi:bifunctional methyltransferase/pyrophosphohydrolase YabN [Gudongella sp. SC589]|uniref:nucleoside triphosphate pyrophosphohydrolase n=1 Tax=Gudongella sp. SC589 TaxID=3385990 RepID=UPI003904B4D6